MKPPLKYSSNNSDDSLVADSALWDLMSATEEDTITVSSFFSRRVLNTIHEETDARSILTSRMYSKLLAPTLTLAAACIVFSVFTSLQKKECDCPDCAKLASQPSAVPVEDRSFFSYADPFLTEGRDDPDNLGRLLMVTEQPQHHSDAEVLALIY